MAKRKTSERQKTHYSMYEGENREAKNRLRKLKRHVKAFPEDQQAATALANFEKNGVPHRRKNRSTGIHLTPDLKRILNQTGNRLSKSKVAMLGLLNNPAGRRPEHLKSEYDYVNAVMSRKVRVRHKTVMRAAFEEARADYSAKNFTKW